MANWQRSQTEKPAEAPEPAEDKPVGEKALLSALEIVLAKFQQQPAAGGLTEDALSRILEGQRKAMKPENAVAPDASVFNPQGGKRPKLSRTTFFVGARMHEDLLTNDEIEAFNAITSNKEAREGRWVAKVTRNGSDAELHINVPHKEIDQRMELPSLLLILRELRDGADAVNPDRLAERVAELERKLAAQSA